MPDLASVTVAPGRTLDLTLRWRDAEGVEHSSGAALPEGSAVVIPAGMVSALRAEGVIV